MIVVSHAFARAKKSRRAKHSTHPIFILQRLEIMQHYKKSIVLLLMPSWLLCSCLSTRSCLEQKNGALMHKLLELFRCSVLHPFKEGIPLTSRIWMLNLSCSVHNFRHSLGTHAQSSTFLGKACSTATYFLH